MKGRHTLKKTLFSVLLLGLSTGCGAFDFEIEKTSEEAVLLGNLEGFRAKLQVPGDLIPSQAFNLNIPYEPHGVYLEEAFLELTETEPTGLIMANPFSFIQKLEVVLESTKAGSTLPPIVLASTGPTYPVHSVPLTIEDGANLLPYVEEGIRITPKMDGIVPAATLSCQFRFKLGVDVF